MMPADSNHVGGSVSAPLRREAEKKWAESDRAHAKRTRKAKARRRRRETARRQLDEIDRLSRALDDATRKSAGTRKQKRKRAPRT
jgi:hypothetical protein